ncbi:succinate dehydrogenase cytochrome b subunit [Asanoa sp. NPDC050611]|uniref:succinate dehydrogenase cytochrome b subunit n=1 Tax=Asanoa sp. NPDC050611 TaxID=3157098 RepID=UPI003411ADBF
MVVSGTRERAAAATPSTGAPGRKAVYRSTVGAKGVMAVSGLLLLLFLVAHMAGNLKIFFGAESFDHYAHWLRDIGAPVLPHTWYLWIQRFVLTAAVVGHAWAATVLALRAKRARPVRYAHRPKVQGSYAARTMRWGGVIILLFIVWHLLDLTVGTVNPVGNPATPYANVVADFAPSRWPVTLFYALAIVAIGFHVRHGLFSALRTLGQRTAKGERRARLAALGFAILLCAGFLVVPFAVLVGLVG